MQFISSLPTFEEDLATKSTWIRLEEKLSSVEGICYYQHPIISSATQNPPDLAILANGYKVIVATCLPYQIDDISSIKEDAWEVSGSRIDSPLLALEDYVIGLEHKFMRDRRLRNAIEVLPVLSLPGITMSDFYNKFGHCSIPDQISVAWGGWRYKQCDSEKLKRIRCYSVETGKVDISRCKSP